MSRHEIEVLKMLGTSKGYVACDGPDVVDRWVKLHEEFHQPRFWALHGDQ